MARLWVADDNNGVCHAHCVTTEGPLWLCPLVPPCWDRPMEQHDCGVTEGEDMVAKYWLGRCCSQVAGGTSAHVLLSRASLLSTPEFPGQGHLREKTAAARHPACGRVPRRVSTPTRLRPCPRSIACTPIPQLSSLIPAARVSPLCVQM